MSDRASELRAIADGRLMLHVRNGVTVARSMLARIADEFETMSAALAAKDAELERRDMQLEASAKVALDLSAQLAEANKALNYLNDAIEVGLPDQEISRRAQLLVPARRAREAQGG